MRFLPAVLGSAMLFAVLPSAFADTFQFTIGSSVTAHLSNTSNDNFLGWYVTGPSPFFDSTNVSIPNPGVGGFPNIAFSIPAGDVVTSARLTLTVPVQATGTAVLGGVQMLPPPDWDDPVHIAPTFGAGTATMQFDAYQPRLSGMNRYGVRVGDSLVFDLSSLLNIDGNQISTAVLEQQFLSGFAQARAMVADPGHNWAGYVGASAVLDVPFTLEVTGTDSPVPEPSTLALLGTGVLGLAGAARRKVSARA